MADSDIIRRQPPHAVDVERALISSVLLGTDQMQNVAEILSPADFYDKRYQIIYEKMYDMYRRSVTFDVSLLATALKSGPMPELGGIDFLRQLLQSEASSVAATRYAEEIREKSILRRLIRDCDTLIDRAYTGDGTVTEILEEAERLIFALVQKRRTTDFATMRDVMLRVIDSMEENAKKEGHVTGVPSGFKDLDERTSGFQKSDLILVAARPAMGKTAFCLNIALNAAMSGYTTAVFSLEMSAEQLGTRLLSMDSGVDSRKIRIGKLDRGEWDRVLVSSDKMAGTELLMDDTAGISLGEVRSKCRKAKIENNLGLVVIDYLQLMTGSGRENRQQEISEISRGLKLLAKELEVPVIALSQLSRACESRQDHRPMLSDLRESGAIEQDADVVMFLYRDEYYHEDSTDKGLAEVIIAKQRNGSTGTVKLTWIAEHTRFANYIDAQAYEGN
ncbi:MAG: replicative DNA helicase [Eubacteriales bacterium]|nr:replicative DNA helicase [Eubacteriales bacterium]